ncbi:outer membrane beta-barrel protein [Terriglobus roseus]|uniref:Outer membrane protein beta-barrel domain-containing protein n=1 Tax=Terriglobus roseus TaxID=392734 RepID=A0A1H4MC96_9BACT|nr:outer membrane beta-barrel protein [Terriglobus roseus]SEB80563.1 hypothetical protein SAMN05443244_1886 [Terriglobus roseus]
MKTFAAAFALLLATTTACHAQLGLYGGFTTSTLKLANTPRLNGGTFGLYYDTTYGQVVALGIDARVEIVTNTTNPGTTVTSVLLGPRLAIPLPAVGLRPYIEVLVGGAHSKAGQGFASTDSGGVVAGGAVGADLRILPHVDWRVLDYSYMRVQGLNTYQQSFTTGVVVRFK